MVVEELLLVKGITPEIYLKLKNLITVFGEGKVNLNTAEPQTLEILINACVKKIQTPGGTPPPPPLDLLNGVLGYRQEHGFFTELDLGNLIDLLSLDQAVFARLVNEFKQLVVVRSQNFRIIATGRLDSKGRQRQIDCVYDRDNKKILFWHES